MATTLAQEFARANDPAFQLLVRQAIWRTLPDVIGEVTGAGLTQLMINKRHAWALDFLRQPDFWIPRVAAMLAGETQIRNVEPITVQPSDAVMSARFSGILSDLAGVTAVDVAG